MSLSGDTLSNTAYGFIETPRLRAILATLVAGIGFIRRDCAIGNYNTKLLPAAAYSSLPRFARRSLAPPVGIHARECGQTPRYFESQQYPLLSPLTTALVGLVERCFCPHSLLKGDRDNTQWEQCKLPLYAAHGS